MAYFQAVGVIATDLIRRETRGGVLASFRLRSGAPGRGQLWITVEAWGNTAGILHTHASTGRGVTVSGRLTYNSWRDHATGDNRSSLVVTAADFDFLGPDHDPTSLELANQVVAVGRINDDPRIDEAGARALFTLTSGRAGSKTGRLWLPVEAWGRTLETAQALRKRDHVAVTGRLTYRTRADTDGVKTTRHELSAYTLSPIARRSATASN